MKRSLTAMLIVAALGLAGCADITMTTTCPASSTGVSFALAGSTVGNQVLSMLGNLGQTAGMLAAARAGATATPPPTSATMTYKYIAAFGADSGSLSCTQPPSNTTVVTSAPASIVR